MLSLFDTAGQECYEHLRPFMYPDTDVILICFAVDNPTSLSNVSTNWLPEVRRTLAKVPILLLGLKTDLRSNIDFSPGIVHPHSSEQGSSSQGHDSVNFRENQIERRRFVHYEDGQKMASQIGAKAYFECSAKNNQGLTPIFQEAARLSLRYRRGSSLRRISSIFSPRTSIL